MREVTNFCQVCRKDDLGWRYEKFEYNFIDTTQIRVIMCKTCAEQLHDMLKSFIAPKLDLGAEMQELLK